MHVLVAGATGAIGRPLVRQLVAAGHDVSGTTRSDRGAARVVDDGGRAVVVDALDRDTLIEAVVAAKPDVIVHELTQIPDDMNPRRIGQEFEATDRLRTEGTRNLIEAAAAAGADPIVAQSIAFAYRFDGAPDDLKTEDDPLIGSDAPKDFRHAQESMIELERAVLDSDGTVLRYGYFYGPGTSYAASDGAIAERVRKRGFPIVGDGGGVFSFIHVEDAAAATVAAIERGGAGVYNVVDDEPAPVREWLPVYAEALGAKPPRSVPVLAARMAAGKWMTLSSTKARGASNAKAKRELAWEPRYPSWRQGFLQAAG
jgi:nucleoside-diphosphate-sugar epimerase